MTAALTVLAAILSAASDQPAAVSARLPPPPPFQSAAPPTQSRVDHIYSCFQGEVRVSLRRDQNRGTELIQWRRRGRALNRQQLVRATEGLQQLTGVSWLYPLCSSEGDALMVHGYVGDRRAHLFLNWDQSGVRFSQPELAPR